MRRGFTLIEISVVISIIALVLYGSMTTLVVSVQQAQYNSTVATMDAIEKALLNYSVAFGRIPCPSSLTTTITSPNYGVEAANPGSCTGGSPAANSTGSGVAEGGVPVRALRLPDSFMYDAWGHCFRYAVNTTYTPTSALTPTSTSDITINDASGVSGSRSTAAIYAIISHGANGHGGYSSGGVIFNAGSTNADELTNCNCDHTGAPNGSYVPTYVQRAPMITTVGSPHTGFDDIVTYKEAWQMTTPNEATNSFLVNGYSRSITIDHTKVGTVNNTDQTNFPLLFAGTYNYLRTTGNGGNVINASGYDITFTSDAAGKTLLPFERESYNASTGAVVFWINVPTVSHTTNTVIYLNYGNSSTSTDQSSKAATWNANYKGVWHLGETSGNPADSTSYGLALAKTGAITQGAAGVFGNAYSFSGSSTSHYMSVADPGDHHLSFGAGSFSISAWGNFGTVAPTGYWNMIWKGGDPSSSYGYELFADNDVPVNLGATISDGSTEYYANEPETTLNSWHHVVQVIDAAANKQHIYVDGVESGAAKSITGHGSTTGPSALYMAWSGGPDTVTGAMLQEVHIVNGVETADWIKTEYNNQNSPSTFYTVGSAVTR